MRMLLRVSIPVEAGNAAIQAGTLGSTIERILADLKPEAAYFFADDSGQRSGSIVFDMQDSSQIPAIAEPWFLGLPPEERFQTVRAMTRQLEQEGAAYDVASHRASPPGLRIWTGPTVETADVELLLPWLDWTWGEQCRIAKAA